MAKEKKTAHESGKTGLKNKKIPNFIKLDSLSIKIFLHKMDWYQMILTKSQF